MPCIAMKNRGSRSGSILTVSMKIDCFQDFNNSDNLTYDRNLDCRRRPEQGYWKEQ